MNEEILNELLEQLKSNLKNVESAKQQVEKTVGAYNAFEGQIDGFVRELGFITQNTRTIINQLEEVKRNFTSNVSANLEDKITQGVNSINSNTEAAKNELKQYCDNIITQGVHSVNSNSNAIKNEILQHCNDINININTNKTDISNKINNESVSISNKIDTVKNTIISDVQNAKNTVTSTINNSEQRMLQQINERGDAIQADLRVSARSIKVAVYLAIGFSFITLCLVIYILTKL